jgi:hypothetical protein
MNLGNYFQEHIICINKAALYKMFYTKRDTGNIFTVSRKVNTPPPPYIMHVKSHNKIVTKGLSY